jgi:hypothetical protein
MWALVPASTADSPVDDFAAPTGSLAITHGAPVKGVLQISTSGFVLPHRDTGEFAEREGCDGGGARCFGVEL